MAAARPGRVPLPRRGRRSSRWIARRRVRDRPAAGVGPASSGASGASEGAEARPSGTRSAAFSGGTRTSAYASEASARPARRSAGGSSRTPNVVPCSAPARMTRASASGPQSAGTPTARTADRRADRATRRSRCARSSTSRAYGRSSTPSSVVATWRRERSNSGPSKCASSVLMRRLRSGWAIPSRSAAREKLASSTAATYASRCASRSTLESYQEVMGPSKFTLGHGCGTAASLCLVEAAHGRAARTATTDERPTSHGRPTDEPGDLCT